MFFNKSFLSEPCFSLEPSDYPNFPDNSRPAASFHQQWNEGVEVLDEQKWDEGEREVLNELKWDERE
jgi:hypothetical protein